MPTFIAGKDNKILFGAYDLTSYFNSANFSREQAVNETTTFGSSQATYIGGIESASASLTGFWDGGSDAVDEELQAIIGSASATPLSIYQSGDTAGNKVVLLNSKIQNYTIDSSVADAVGISATFTGDNFGNGKSLYALTNTSATANTTAVDMGASSSLGGQAFLHCTAHSSANISVKIQSSADNSSFADVSGFAFTDLSGITSERIATTNTVNRYVRLAITVTSGSATFSVGYAHNLK
jgi:hypothetical protein